MDSQINLNMVISYKHIEIHWPKSPRGVLNPGPFHPKGNTPYTAWQYAIFTLRFKSLFFLNHLFAGLRELVLIFCKCLENRTQITADILD